MKKQEIERDFVKELTQEAAPATEAKYMPKDARIDSKTSIYTLQPTARRKMQKTQENIGALHRQGRTHRETRGSGDPMVDGKLDVEVLRRPHGWLVCEPKPHTRCSTKGLKESICRSKINQSHRRQH
ncbi:hypothetical protein GBA52_005278 [Prunus armeniaca]|nr:hypothetical protein GBA52_005278 [Prunus armeniaca]